MMVIKNFLDAKKQNLEKSHNRVGSYSLYEIFQKSDFKSNIDFFDRVIIPPNSSIGIHRHKNNEEIYIILSGKSLMIIDGEQVKVKQGDMILNKTFGEHGLVNNSNEDIDILVIQVSCD